MELRKARKIIRNIDRDQYEQQVAELCEARATLARLYDPTPITGEWLVACGGVLAAGTCSLYTIGGFVVGTIRVGMWKVEGLEKCITTRGEFRRAAELLGIKINEAANAAEGE